MLRRAYSHDSSLNNMLWLNSVILVHYKRVFFGSEIVCQGRPKLHESNERKVVKKLCLFFDIARETMHTMCLLIINMK